MREYSKVRPRFWTGDTGREIRKLGAQAQVIAFYLFTCPSANMLGLYYLAMPTLCHETGSPLEGATKALRSLREAKFAYYDAPSEIVYVPNMAREQIGDRLKRKDNRHVAVLRELEQLRKTPFFNEFVVRYRDAFELQEVELEEISRSPLEAPSEPLRSQEQEQEQAQEQTLKSKSPLPPFDPKSIPGLDVDAWNEWVEYRQTRRPAIKPVSKPKAARAMAKLGPLQRATVDHSIAQGYQGLIEPKTNGNGRFHDASTSAKDAAAWAEARRRGRDIGFREPHPTEPVAAYMTSVKQAETTRLETPLAERIGLRGIKRVPQ